MCQFIRGSVEVLKGQRHIPNKPPPPHPLPGIHHWHSFDCLGLKLHYLHLHSIFTFLKFPVLLCIAELLFSQIKWELWPFCFQLINSVQQTGKILTLKFELNNFLLQYCRLTQVICQGFLNFWGHFKLCLRRKLTKWTKASDKRLWGKKNKNIILVFISIYNNYV